LIALYGGSFDPVHIGHLRIAEDIREDFNFDKIVFIPAYHSPLKPSSKAPAKDRLKMLEMAIRYNPYFEIDDLEIRKGGKSFTIDTINEYRKRLNYNPVFIVGTDSLLSLHKWKDADKLIKLTNFIVVGRGKDSFYNVQDYLDEYFPDIQLSTDRNIEPDKTKIFYFDSRRIDISSTEIRSRVKTGKSIKYLVLPEIEEYIIKKNFYKR